MVGKLLAKFDEFLLGLAVALVFALILVLTERGVLSIPLLKTIDLKILDKKFAFKETEPIGDEVVIVGIDEKSLTKIGKWPWKGEVFAEVLDKLRKLGSKIVGFDMIFSAKLDEDVASAIESLKAQVNEALGGSGGERLQSVFERAEGRLRGDKIFSRAIQNFGGTILAYKFLRSEEVSTRGGKEIDFGGKIRGKLISFTGDFGRLDINEAIGFRQSKIPLSTVAQDSGFMNINLDWDGVSRTIPLVYRFKNDVYCAFSVAIVESYLGDRGPTILRFSKDEGLALSIAGREVPVDEEGNLRINYYGPGGKFKTFSFIDVLEGRARKGDFEGKIVLIGAIAPILHDLKATPFEPITPGVEVHATVIDNLIHGNFISRKDPGLVVFEIMIMLLFGMIMGLVLKTWSLWTGLPVLFFLIGGYASLDVFYVFQKGKILVLYLPFIELVTLYMILALFKYSVVEARTKDIKNKFKHYVADTVVEEIIEKKDFNLGTVRKNLTVLFADIRGFAQITEKLDPSLLEKILNRHMTVMTDVIIENRGTVDKYMGDSVMAIFGAPLELSDHPYYACLAAFRMIEKLRDLNHQFEREGLPEIKMGIGINTGEMLVGNLGSEYLFNYTVLGNEVNVASRIEELTKEFNTNIIISEATLLALKDRAVVRNLGEARVKGIEKAVKVFALLGVKGLTD